MISALALLSAKLNAGLTSSATGSYTSASGKEFPYLAFAAKGKSDIYHAEEIIDGNRWIGNWIVLEDGQVCGAQTNVSGKVRSQSTLSKSATLVTAPSQITGLAK